MTWLPDHRAVHGPEAECETCRPPEPAPIRVDAGVAWPPSRPYASLRPFAREAGSSAGTTDGTTGLG
jgi:hypothetical protein